MKTLKATKKQVSEKFYYGEIKLYENDIWHTNKSIESLTDGSRISEGECNLKTWVINQTKSLNELTEGLQKFKDTHEIKKSIKIDWKKVKSVLKIEMNRFENFNRQYNYYYSNILGSVMNELGISAGNEDDYIKFTEIAENIRQINS